MRIALLCALVSCGLLACQLADPGVRDVAFYLAALSALTVVPLLALRPAGTAPLAFVLLTPTLLFSLNDLMLRMGWFNLVKYGDWSWFPDVTEDSLRKAAGLALAGNVLLWAGYLSPAARWLGHRAAGRLSRSITDERVGASMPRIWVAFSLGIGLRVYMISAGLYGYFSEAEVHHAAAQYLQFLNMAEGADTLAMLAYAGSLMKQERPRWGPFAGMLAVELLTVLLMGFKGQIVYRFFYIAVIYAVVRRKFPWRVGLAAVVSLLVVFPINLALRTAFQEGQFKAGDIGGISSGMVKASESAFAFDSTGDFVAENATQIVRASSRLEQFAMVIQYVDSTGTCWYGLDYLYPVIGFIPRAVWPSKPSPSHGEWVYNVVYGVQGNSSESQTVPGDMYLNFGWVGPLAGLFVFGALGRVAASVIWRVTSVRYLALVPYVVHGLGMPEPDLGAYMALTVQRILIYAVVLNILVPGSRAGRAAPTGLLPQPWNAASGGTQGAINAG